MIKTLIVEILLKLWEYGRIATLSDTEDHCPHYFRGMKVPAY